MKTRSLVSALALGAAIALATAGCSTSSAGSDDGTLRVVASTNVYGYIATTIGGNAVNVTSLMSDPAQDPHSFEASAQNQLAVSKADIVIENGEARGIIARNLVTGEIERHGAHAVVLASACEADSDVGLPAGRLGHRGLELPGVDPGREVRPLQDEQGLRHQSRLLNWNTWRKW